MAFTCLGINRYRSRDVADPRHCCTHSACRALNMLENGLVPILTILIHLEFQGSSVCLGSLFGHPFMSCFQAHAPWHSPANIRERMHLSGFQVLWSNECICAWSYINVNLCLCSPHQVFSKLVVGVSSPSLCRSFCQFCSSSCSTLWYQQSTKWMWTPWDCCRLWTGQLHARVPHDMCDHGWSWPNHRVRTPHAGVAWPYSPMRALASSSALFACASWFLFSPFGCILSRPSEVYCLQSCAFCRRLIRECKHWGLAWETFLLFLISGSWYLVECTSIQCSADIDIMVITHVLDIDGAVALPFFPHISGATRATTIDLHPANHCARSCILQLVFSF